MGGILETGENGWRDGCVTMEGGSPLDCVLYENFDDSCLMNALIYYHNFSISCCKTPCAILGALPE